MSPSDSSWRASTSPVGAPAAGLGSGSGGWDAILYSMGVALFAMMNFLAIAVERRDSNRFCHLVNALVKDQPAFNLALKVWYLIPVSIAH